MTQYLYDVRRATCPTPKDVRELAEENKRRALAVPPLPPKKIGADGIVTLSGRDSGIGITYTMWGDNLVLPGVQFRRDARKQDGPLYGDHTLISQMRDLANNIVVQIRHGVWDEEGLSPEGLRTLGDHVRWPDVEGEVNLSLIQIQSLRRTVIVDRIELFDRPRGQKVWKCIGNLYLEMIPGIQVAVGILQSSETGDFFVGIPGDKSATGETYDKVFSYAILDLRPIALNTVLSAYVTAELTGRYETADNNQDWRSCENCYNKQYIPQDNVYLRSPSIRDVVDAPQPRVLCMITMQWCDQDLVYAMHEVEKIQGNERKTEFLYLPEGRSTRRDKFERDRLSEQGVGCPYHRTMRIREDETWHIESARTDRQRVVLLDGKYFTVAGRGVDIVPRQAIVEGLFMPPLVIR